MRSIEPLPGSARAWNEQARWERSADVPPCAIDDGGSVAVIAGRILIANLADDGGMVVCSGTVTP